MANPTRDWDKVPVWGFYDVDPGTNARVRFTFAERVRSLGPTGEGRVIYPAGKTIEVRVGHPDDQDPIVRNQIKAAVRAADEAALGAAFDGIAWDATWDEMVATKGVFTSFYAADDPDVSPQGWQVQVTESMASGKLYYIQPLLAQLDAPIPGINLASIDVPPGAPSAPAPVYMKDTAGGIAALDEQKRVIANGIVDDNGNPIDLGGGGATTVDGLTDATMIGKALVKATSATAARDAIGAGTSNLQLGVGPTTAKAGDWTPTWGEVSGKPTTFTPTTGTTAATAMPGNTPVVKSINGTTPDGAGNVVVPTATDATTAAKGTVRLTGDLGGTADSPTVPGLAGKYVKPGSGIPATDLAAAVQTSLTKADTALQSVPFGTTAGTAAQGNDSRIVGAVPNTRTVAGKALTADVTLAKGDVGLGNVDNTADSAKTFTAAQVTSGTLDAARMPASLSFDVWQAANGTWPARPPVPAGSRVNWIGYPGNTTAPTGATAGIDTSMPRPA